MNALLRNHADPNAKDYSGRTPLQFAALQYNPSDGVSAEVVQALLDNGADPKGAEEVIAIHQNYRNSAVCFSCFRLRRLYI